MHRHPTPLLSHRRLNKTDLALVAAPSLNKYVVYRHPRRPKVNPLPALKARLAQGDGSIFCQEGIQDAKNEEPRLLIAGWADG